MVLIDCLYTHFTQIKIKAISMHGHMESTIIVDINFQEILTQSTIKN